MSATPETESSQRIFRHPRSWGWRFAIGAPAMLAGSAAMVVLPLAARSPFALLLVPLGGWCATGLVTQILSFASSVALSEDALVARRYLLLPDKRIQWSDVASIEPYSKFLWDCNMVVRITDRRNRGSIAFTDAVDDFQGLMGAITDRAEHARHRQPPLAWRALWW